MRRLRILAPLGALSLAAAAPPSDTLTLDRADPVLDATIAGVPARLSLALDARPAIELSPDFAQRISVDWHRGFTAAIGRVLLPSRIATTQIGLADALLPVAVATHDRPCCAGHDGAIGPRAVPWAIVRIGTAPGVPERRYPAAYEGDTGLFVPWQTPAGIVRLVPTPQAPRTVATASAAAILAQAFGGHLTGDDYQLPIVFGVSRQVRDMVFDTPASLAGLPLPRIAVRYADFAGRSVLPQAGGDGGIVVSRKGLPPQRDWPVVALGADLLDRCPAIAVYREGPAIGLSCRP